MAQPSGDDNKHKQALKVAQTGDDAISGDTPDLESDDDMLENAHEMGLYKGDDGENPQELNIADQVLSAEKKRRGLD